MEVKRVFSCWMSQKNENFILKFFFSLNMRTKKLSKEEFYKELAEAKKDPKFHRDIRKFIKITTGVYKLKDYGLENL